MVGETEELAETIPKTCPECGREALAVVHDTGKAAAVYESHGTCCTVDGNEVDTALVRDRLFYVHD
jgi:hypothetical protein